MVSLKLLSTTAMAVYKGLKALHQIFYGPMLRNMAATDWNIFKKSDTYKRWAARQISYFQLYDQKDFRETNSMKFQYPK